MLRTIFTEEQRHQINHVRARGNDISLSDVLALLDIIAQLEASEFRLNFFDKVVGEIEDLIDAEKYESASEIIRKTETCLTGNHFDFLVLLELVRCRTVIDSIHFFGGEDD